MSFYDSINNNYNIVSGFRSDPMDGIKIYARGYAKAASLAASQFLSNSNNPDYDGYPIVFLYRHSLELYLKGLYYQLTKIAKYENINIISLNVVTKHKLILFSEALYKASKAVFPDNDALHNEFQKIMTIAKEFEEIDKDSYSFRYPTDTKGNYSTSPHQIVNIEAVSSTMNKLFQNLEIIDFGFDVTEDMAQEAYSIIDDLNNSLSNYEE